MRRRLSTTTKIFIAHASEDKDEVARPLAVKLREAGFDVWYDEYSLMLGDNLRRVIERGLNKCSFGVVILSPNFFAKEWPARELDALLLKEDDGSKVILPIWHSVGRAEVSSYSRIIAAKLAVNTKVGLHEVTAQIVRAVNRELARRESKFDKVPKLRHFGSLISIRIHGSTICDKAKEVFADQSGIAISHIKTIKIILFEDFSGCDEYESYIELWEGTKIEFQTDIIIAAAARACPSLAETHIPCSWAITERSLVQKDEEYDLSQHELVVAFVLRFEDSPPYDYIRSSLLAIAEFSETYPMSEYDLWWGSQSIGRKLVRIALSNKNWTLLQNLLRHELSSDRRAAFLCAKSIVEEVTPNGLSAVDDLLEFLLSKQSPLNDHWKAKITVPEKAS